MSSCRGHDDSDGERRHWRQRERDSEQKVRTRTHGSDMRRVQHASRRVALEKVMTAGLHDDGVKVTHGNTVTRANVKEQVRWTGRGAAAKKQLVLHGRRE